MTTVHCSHSINMPLTPEHAFGLFTPLGERDWIEDWDPRFIHPADGETAEGMAFETNHGGRRALWTCTRYRPASHEVQYARFSDGSHIAIIDVACAAVAGGESEVTVAYRITALGEEGEAYLARYSANAYRAMIAGWRERLAAHCGFA